jgi:hypothetical protein
MLRGGKFISSQNDKMFHGEFSCMNIKIDALTYYKKKDSKISLYWYLIIHFWAVLKLMKLNKCDFIISGRL